MFEEYHEDHASSHDQTAHHGEELKNYMFFQNLKTIKNAIEELINMDPKKVDAILDMGHGWALDHIATSVDDVEEVYHFLANREEGEMGGEAEPMPTIEEPEVVIVNPEEVEVEDEEEDSDDDSDDDEE